jgi:hypothetical protein
MELVDVFAAGAQLHHMYLFWRNVRTALVRMVVKV